MILCASVETQYTRTEPGSVGYTWLFKQKSWETRHTGWTREHDVQETLMSTVVGAAVEKRHQNPFHASCLEN